MNRCILTLSCPDRLGIVHAVSGFLADRGANILDSQQFGDRSTRRFFMRVHIECTDPRIGIAELRRDFSAVAEAFSMTWQIHDEEERTRTIIMVSRLGHCLNDLLYRWHIGALPADIVAVVSNHRDFEDLAASYGIPYHYIPVTRKPRRKPKTNCSLSSTKRASTSSSSPGTCKFSPPRSANASPGKSSIFTTHSSRVSAERGRTTRPTNAASNSSAQPPTTSPQHSTKVPSSNRK